MNDNNRNDTPASIPSIPSIPPTRTFTWDDLIGLATHYGSAARARPVVVMVGDGDNRLVKSVRVLKLPNGSIQLIAEIEP